MSNVTDINKNLKSLFSQEIDIFVERTPRSKDVAQQATATMPGGVPTGVSALDPYPIVIDHGLGSKIVDIDANEYIDYANGFGTSVFGHANPIVTKAIQDQAAKGTHFGTLTEIAYHWSSEICQRFNYDWVRFVASGTEATMDAIRIARSRTGRDKIIKVEGAYHGTHPEALVSPNLSLDIDPYGDPGPDDAPNSRAFGSGVSSRVLEDVVITRFNHIESTTKLLEENEIAAVIVEPILFNVGTIFPEPGYLQALLDACRKNGALLIFDETKTGASVAYGGAEELFGVTPDIKTLGKGVGGGLPVGVVGETTDTSYEKVRDFDIPLLGTFSGNPLVAAAGFATLSKVLTPEAFVRLNDHQRLISKGLDEIIQEFNLPVYTLGAGAKTCIVWVNENDGNGRLKDFRDYQRRFNFDAGYAAWLFFVNRGIFLAPGQDEQLTHSIAHGEEEADRLVSCFRELAKALVA